jgi:hypothetical protein
LPYIVVMYKVKQCLSLCDGPLYLSIDHCSGDRVLNPKLISRATRSLRSSIRLAPVVKLKITFNALSDESVLVCAICLTGC